MAAYVVSVKNNTVIVQLEEPPENDVHLTITQTEPLKKDFILVIKHPPPSTEPSSTSPWSPSPGIRELTAGFEQSGFSADTPAINIVPTGPDPSTDSLSFPHSFSPQQYSSESPGSHLDAIPFFDSFHLVRRQDDISSSCEDDAFLPSPGSPVFGTHSPSSISPVPSPGIQDLTTGFEHLDFPVSAQPHDSLGVPISPELLQAHNPPLQRSNSARPVGHRTNFSQNDALFPQYLEARGRGRTRANTAPSSRRHSPYAHPYAGPSEHSPSAQPSSSHPSPQQQSNEVYQPDAAIPFFSLSSDAGYNNQPSPSPSYRQTLTIDTTNLPSAPPLMSVFVGVDEFPTTPLTAGEGSFEPEASGSRMFIPIAKQVVTTTKARQAAEGKRLHPQKFECDLCQQKFTTKNKRDRHLDAHFGIKRYRCNIEGCNKAFTSSADCKRHQEKSKHP